ncbi:MAG: AAA family ATPase [Prevotella sp.]|nr:AAA family ATPase [Prevotella sp.]
MNKVDLAWHIISNTDTHLFLTGKAGTGKTTFLRRLKDTLPKRMVVLAPTGIAAINAGGSTIHSFFQFGFGPLLPGTKRERKYQFRKQKIQLIRSLDLIVIDEISMVRADVLDAIDEILRQYRDRSLPFGGVQMLLIGDMQQLAPVARDEEWQLLSLYYSTPYFFSCHVLQNANFVTIELEHVYRQSDAEFIDILNQVRDNTITDASLAKLNEHYQPNFIPPKKSGYVRLCTHNRQADTINDRELQAICADEYSFIADIDGDFPEMSYPTEKVLRLKEGAQVMFVKNDSSLDKEYYNGMIGEVIQFDKRNLIHVKCAETGKVIKVGREQWKNTRYTLDKVSKEIYEETVGTFEQYPLKAAWAITVHKSQGLTFDHAIIDVQHSFAHGQTYVALSRCKNLKGLVLSSPIPRHAIINDRAVEQFYNDPRHQEPDDTLLMHMEKQFLTHTIDILFSLQPLRQGINDTLRFLREHFYTQMPKTYAKWQDASERLKPLEDVAKSFHNQYYSLIMREDNDILQERIMKGAAYFEDQLLFIRILLKATILNSDSKNIRNKRDEIIGNITNQYKLKFQLLHYVAHNGFNLQNYLKTKSRLVIS